MPPDPERTVHRAVRRAARSVDAPLLLAISGGLDSMALLAAMASQAPRRIAAIATFDHGTGPAAEQAAAHVVDEGARRGISVVAARMSNTPSDRRGGEDRWRRARHAFLAEAAGAFGARIVTAHTEDDQIETVLMRTMRGSGARGLAALLGPGPLRPFIGVRRAELERYVVGAGLSWVEDPSNRSSAFLRNRLRHDVLPALRRVRPAIDDELLAVGREAAAWRASVEGAVDRELAVTAHPDGSLLIGRRELSRHSRDSVAMLCGALALRAGLALDRRGTVRVAEFITSGKTRGVVPVSSGWVVEAEREGYHLRRRPELPGASIRLPEQGTLEWGRFRFRVGVGRTAGSPWAAEFPAAAMPIVRRWGAGERLSSSAGHPPRRVSRFLSDAGVRGLDRAAWPVVAIRDGVVWIPGVRRSDAATERSGGPVQHVVCDRLDR